MPQAIVNGRSLFYFEHAPQASGLPLVLIHGAGGTHLHWPAEVRRLPGVRVLALDLPGHGQSDGPAGETIADRGQAVLDWLEALGVEQAVIGGHSMGGAVAQWLALEHPQRVAGLALVATGARLRVAPEILDRVQTDLPGAVDLVVSWMFGPAASENLLRVVRQRMLEMDAAAMLGDWRACDSFDVRAQLGSVRAPALVLCGTADQLTPEKHARFLAENIAGAELHLLPGSGHMVMLEQPRAVARHLAEFLTRLSG